MSAKIAAQYAGCRQANRARSTGTLVLVVNGDEAGVDTDDGQAPWSTICDDHGTICSHETLKLARYHAVAPEEWCDECREPGSSNPYGDLT